MEFETEDIVIIGAGLAGLAIAHYLRESGLRIKIVESRDRIGGRIHTVKNHESAPLEMGATWLGIKHQNLEQLLHELDVEVFEQKIGSTAIYEAISTSPHYLAQLPTNPEPSLRIAGGTKKIITKLAQSIPSESIMLNASVNSLISSEHGIKVGFKNGRDSMMAKKVVSTLPPNLFVSKINCVPELPKDFKTIAAETHTWMGESIKIALTFDKPFWRSEGLSGTIFSNVGPVPEMYDHSNVEDNSYALMGFLSGNYWKLKKEERLELILMQMRKYYGDSVDTFTSYEEKVWRNDEETFTPYTSNLLPHQNNGHHVFRRTYMEGRLLIGGTETATFHPGYMEGAIVSAKEISQKLMS